MKYKKGKNIDGTVMKIDKDYIEKIKIILKEKQPDRKVYYDVEAVREALMDYIQENKRFLEDDKNETV